MHVKVSKNMRLRLPFVIVILLLLTAHTSCEEVKPRQWNDPILMTMALTEPPHGLHTFIFAAQMEGNFQRRGLRTKVDIELDPQTALAGITEEKYQFVLTNQAEVVLARSEGNPVQAVATIMSEPLYALLTTANVKSPSELEGRKIGYSGKTLEKEIVKAMLAFDGGDPKRLEFIDVGVNGVEALAEGTIEALAYGSLFRDLYLLEEAGITVTALHPSDYGVPALDGIVIATHEEQVKKQTLATEYFIDALYQGQAFVIDHTRRASVVLVSQQAKEYPLDRATELAVMENLIPMMTAEEDLFAKQTEASWQQVIDWMLKAGLISEEVPVKSVFKNL